MLFSRSNLFSDRKPHKEGVMTMFSFLAEIWLGWPETTCIGAGQTGCARSGVIPLLAEIPHAANGSLEA